MGAVTTGSGKKKRIITNTAPSAGLQKPGPAKKKTYKEEAEAGICEIKGRIAEAFKASPVRLRFDIEASDEAALIHYSYVKKADISVPYGDYTKDGKLDVPALTQAALGMLYKECMAQMSDEKLAMSLVKVEKESLMSGVRKKLEEEFVRNGNRGLVLGSKKIKAEFFGESFPLGLEIKDWIPMRDYIVVDTSVTPPVITYAFPDDETRDEHAIQVLKDYAKDVVLHSWHLAPRIPQLYKRREEIAALHDILLDGTKNYYVLKKPKILYKPLETDTVIVDSTIGTYTLDADMNVLKYDMLYTDNIKRILSTEYQKLSSKLKEEIKKRGYKVFSYAGGAGLLNEGITKINIGREGEKVTTTKILMAEGGLPKENMDKFFERAEAAYREQAEKDKRAKKEKYLARLADKSFHKDEFKLFKKKHKMVYEGETTQVMFLYLDKNGGTMPKADFDAFVDNECQADDIRNIMLCFLAQAEVVSFDTEKIALGPNAKYMRRIVSELLHVDKNNMDKTICMLEKQCVACREERNVRRGNIETNA